MVQSAGPSHLTCACCAWSLLCCGCGQSVSDGGILLITCTDMAVLCGNHAEVRTCSPLCRRLTHPCRIGYHAGLGCGYCSIRLLIGSDRRALSQVCFTKYGAMSLKGKVPPPLPPAVGLRAELQMVRYSMRGVFRFATRWRCAWF